MVWIQIEISWSKYRKEADNNRRIVINRSRKINELYKKISAKNATLQSLFGRDFKYLLLIEFEKNTGLHMVAGHGAFSGIIFLPWKRQKIGFIGRETKPMTWRFVSSFSFRWAYKPPWRTNNTRTRSLWGPLFRNLTESSHFPLSSITKAKHGTMPSTSLFR